MPNFIKNTDIVISIVVILLALGLWLILKSRKPKVSAEECVRKPEESPRYESRNRLDCNGLKQKAAAQSKIYSSEGQEAMAKALIAVADVIADNFGDHEIDFMVSPTAFDSNVSAPDTLPVHFLFRVGGKARVAVVIVTASGYKTPRVLATYSSCRRKGIKYLRVFATGSYADWIVGERNGKPCPQSVVDMCKRNLVDRIENALRVW